MRSKLSFGHANRCLHDSEAGIAWVRFGGYDPTTVVAEETDAGLREIDPAAGETVGLESGTRAGTAG
jgi:hypothetical protein